MSDRVTSVEWWVGAALRFSLCTCRVSAIQYEVGGNTYLQLVFHVFVVQCMGVYRGIPNVDTKAGDT